MEGNTTYRVYNRCKFNIGVEKPNHLQFMIRPGGFQMMTADDIAFVEANCRKTKFFAQKYLVAVDDDGKDLDPSFFRIVVDEDAPQHLQDKDIITFLKLSNNKMKLWLATINNPAELDAIYTEAKKMDLPASKIAILRDKMPDKDWMGEMDRDPEA